MVGGAAQKTDKLIDNFDYCVIIKYWSRCGFYSEPEPLKADRIRK
jgi:hypothetical protein